MDLSPYLESLRRDLAASRRARRRSRRPQRRPALHRARGVGPAVPARGALRRRRRDHHQARRRRASRSGCAAATPNWSSPRGAGAQRGRSPRRRPSRQRRRRPDHAAPAGAAQGAGRAGRRRRGHLGQRVAGPRRRGGAAGSGGWPPVPPAPPTPAGAARRLLSGPRWPTAARPRPARPADDRLRPGLTPRRRPEEETIMYEFQTPGPIMVSARIRSGGRHADRRGARLRRSSRSSRPTAATRPASRPTTPGSSCTATPWSSMRPRPPAGSGGAAVVRVTARVPIDSGFDVQVASADAEVRGRWREGSLNSASGDVQIEAGHRRPARQHRQRRLRSRPVGGDARVTSASGDVAIGSVGGDAVLHSASGDLRVADTGGSVQARTASGDIDLLRARRGELRAQSASGDVSVAVLPGTGVYLDVRTLSGSHPQRPRPSATHRRRRRRNRAPTLSVRVHTVSGDIAVMRAPAGDRRQAALTSGARSDVEPAERLERQVAQHREHGPDGEHDADRPERQRASAAAAC